VKLIGLLIGCFCALAATGVVSAQPNGPWNAPLMMAWSTDGEVFATPTIFQDSSGVPCVVRWKGDTLACVFQWFREPRTAPTWDRVAVKFSYDAGMTWTEPTPIVIDGFPSTYQRPFDPTLAVVDGQLRIYYSSSDGMPMGGLTAIVNTYSAIGSDGIHYTFESGARYDHATRPAIDPAVIFYKGIWHYSAPAGAPQDGAFHATSEDGLTFTPQAPYLSDMEHNWTGNYTYEVGPLQTDTALRFYGSGRGLWFARSTNGAQWGPYRSLSLQGGDPSAVQVAPNRWLIIYVGPPYVTSVDNNSTAQKHSCSDIWQGALHSHYYDLLGREIVRPNGGWYISVQRCDCGWNRTFIAP
jgi:hypothetical protein